MAVSTYHIVMQLVCLCLWPCLCLCQQYALGLEFARMYFYQILFCGCTFMAVGVVVEIFCLLSTSPSLVTPAQRRADPCMQGHIPECKETFVDVGIVNIFD